METNKKTRIWWWFFLAVAVLSGLGYYLYLKTWSNLETPLTEEKVSSVEQEVLSPEPVTVVSKERQKIPPHPPAEKEISPQVTAKQNDCAKTENDIADFLQYLNEKKQIRRLLPGRDIPDRFRQIIKKLEARPPVPGGEGMDPKIMIQNMYHFFRVLNRKDILLIKEIIRSDQDTLEATMKMFHSWLILGDECPDHGHVRPSLPVLYRYAAFFLNTTGGRAYLYRRTPSLRLLVSYYCLLIINNADKTGKNYYGIDIFPFIKPLTEEISRYPDFQFQSEYISNLNKMEGYYSEKRRM